MRTWAFEEDLGDIYWTGGYDPSRHPLPGYSTNAFYLGYAPYWQNPDGSVYFDLDNAVKKPRHQYRIGTATVCEKKRFRDPYPYRLKSIVDRRSDKVLKPHQLTLSPDPRTLSTKEGWAGLVTEQTLNYTLPQGQVVSMDHTIELQFGFNNMCHPTDESNLTPTAAVWEQIVQELNLIWTVEGIQWWEAIAMPATVFNPSSAIRLTVRFIGVVTDRYIRIALTSAPLAAAALILPPSLTGDQTNGGYVHLRQFVSASVIGLTGTWILNYLGPPGDPPPAQNDQMEPIINVSGGIVRRIRKPAKKLRVVRWEWI